MTQIKTWFTSKTIIAGAVGVVFNILAAFGVNNLEGVAPSDVAENVVNVVNAGLFAVAIYGRFTAKKTIGKADVG